MVDVLINICNRKIIDIYFCFWFLIVSLSGLTTTVHPLVSWFASFVLIVLIAMYLIKQKKLYLDVVIKNNFNLLFLVVFFLFALNILLVGVLNHQYFKAIIYFLKYIIILILLLSLVFYRPSRNVILISIKISLFVNFIILVMALYFGLSMGLIIAGDGRMGTILNEPGTLWKIGFYSAIILVILYNQDAKKEYIVYLLMSFFLMNIDGSRTSQLLIILTFLFLMIVNFLHKEFFKKIFNMTLLAILFILMISITEFVRETVRTHIDGHNTEQNQPLALQRLLQATATTMTTANDITRSQMVWFAIEQIKQQPFTWGKGIESAKVPTATSSEGIVVHMTYFQVWLDYGLIGFLLYMAIFIILAIMIYKRINYQDWAFMVAAYIVFSYAFISLLHPLSNEITYWAIFIVFVSYLMIGGTKQEEQYE